VQVHLEKEAALKHVHGQVPGNQEEWYKAALLACSLGDEMDRRVPVISTRGYNRRGDREYR